MSVAEKAGLEPKVLIVTNQKRNGSLWEASLGQRGICVLVETDPILSLRRFEIETPDLLILDVDLGEAATLDLIRSLRAEMFIPIILLAVSPSVEFMLEAYKAGVDDCIAKPVASLLFQAKVMVWLKRSWNSGPGALDPMKVGQMHLLPAEKTIVMNGCQPVRLTNLEMRLLYNLMSRVGHAVTVEELNQKIWGYSGEIDGTLIKNVVYRLRRKIEPDPAKPHIIETVAGVGYRLSPE